MSKQKIYDMSFQKFFPFMLQKLKEKEEMF